MFSAILSSLIGRVMAISLIVMTAAFGVQTLRVANLKLDLKTATTNLATCQQAKQEESDNRESERSTDVGNETRQARFCRAEREAAVVAGRAIEDIVNGKNEDGTNRSGIVTADELRNVVSERSSQTD